MKQATRFIICSRKHSRRVPNKPFVKINGKPIIEHLIERLSKILTPVYVAIPGEDISDYMYLQEKYGNNVVQLFCGDAKDPLKRMYECAKTFDIDNAIRVTHDKIFIEEKQVFEGLSAYMQKGLGYLYSSSMLDGTAFEIIHRDVLEDACKQFKNVEHISYSVKAVAKNSYDFPFNTKNDRYRFLIDFPEDVTFFQTLFACLGNRCSLDEVLEFLRVNSWVAEINRLPLITVYTCSFNNEETIQVAMDSVQRQHSERGLIEYILVDDFSNDDTSYQMSKFANENKTWVKYLRNDENIGLASSSNVALANARGKYIIRIDADDYFSHQDALSTLYAEIETRNIDVVYPGFYDGSMHKVGNPKENHHPAGAIFRTRALNHIKFTDKLRNYDGLDLYMRAKKQLKIGYLMKPLFFYRHRDNSMSRTNLEQREITKFEILNDNGSEC